MKKAALPLIALIAFTLYTLWVMLQAEQSLLQFGLQLISRPDTAQVIVDLYLMAALACIWMYQDNKARRKPFIAALPYIALTVIFVSMGPLLYLVVRGFSKADNAPVRV